ncbi:MAG: 2-polyprenyl-6-methoxyphenol hydroxylase-like FAD-dependent oxidoreductase [Hyphomicrobiaceae bacterium]|jgi:2-polyprenyl-6-methoxyphenol hydroxylase-like FAD-dependent oxidoreductase
MKDLVIVGGGAAGGALATVAARAGLDVTVLERSEVFEDRVRGEWMAPWGVAETKELGLYDDIVAAGGHPLVRHVTYDETLAPAEAEAAGLALEIFSPGVSGPLCLGHPRLCSVYQSTAVDAGVDFRRGVRVVAVTAGTDPSVTFVDSTGEQTLAARLVVAADGRDSSVRRMLGIQRFVDEPHHLFAGLLVDGAFDWPVDLQVIATEGETSFLAFPQGGGRVRLYAAHTLAAKARFAGPDGAQALIDACQMKCCPPSAAFSTAVAAGPCRSFPNSDAISEHVAVDGVVLVGDSAGHNDPLIGQGLSIAHRDVRLVRDVLLNGSDWSARAFTAYADERRSRMHGLRVAAAMQSSVEAEFGDAARARRIELFSSLETHPEKGFGLLAALAGPEAVPAQLYEAAHEELGMVRRPAWPLAPG